MSKPTRFVQPFQNYEILDRLGSGGMGTVFRARRKSDGRIVALKVLRPSLSRNKRYVERLKREAEISIRMDHHALVKGLEFGEEKGYHFLAMEFVDARSLKELLRNWGRFPMEQILDVGKQCTEALQCIHDQGVVHRDIKPGNILIDDEGHIWLTDLGLAKGGEDPSLTRDGATIGTPQYMSPEQARDPASVDERSDLYSLGATLYHMATGQPPFQAETVGKLIHSVLHERIPPASELNPMLDPGFDLVLRKLLMRDPGQRYESARELLQDLERVSRGKAPGVNLRAIEKAERPPTFLHRHKVAIAITAFTLGGWLVLWSLWPSPKGEQEEKIVGIPHLEKVLGELQAPRKRLALLETFEPRTREEKEAFALLREKEYQDLDSRILDFFRKRLGVKAFEDWLRRNELARWKPGYIPHFVEDLFFRDFELLPRDLPAAATEGTGKRGGPREHFKIWMEREEDLIQHEVGRRVGRGVRHLRERFETFGLSRIRALEANGEWGKLVRQLEFWDRYPERLDPDLSHILPLPPGFEAALGAFHAALSLESERVKKRASLRILSWKVQAQGYRERISSLLDLGRAREAFQRLGQYRGFVQNHQGFWRDLPEGIQDPAEEEKRHLDVLGPRVRQELLQQEQGILDTLLDGVLHFCLEGKEFQSSEQLLLRTQFSSEFLSRRAQTVAEDLLLAREAGESILDSLVHEKKRQSFLLVRPPETFVGTPFARENLVLLCKGRKGEHRSIPIGRLETNFLLARGGQGDILQGIQKEEELGLLLFFLGRDTEALRLIGRTKRDPSPILQLSRRRKVFEASLRMGMRKQWKAWLRSVERSLEQGRWEQANGLLKLLPQVFPQILRDKESADTFHALEGQLERIRHLRDLRDRLGEPLRRFSRVQALAGKTLRVTVDFFSPQNKQIDFGDWSLQPLGLVSPSPEKLGEYRPGSPFGFELPFLDPRKEFLARFHLRIPKDRGLAGFRVDLGRTHLFLAQAPGKPGVFGVLRGGEGMVDALRAAAATRPKGTGEPWFLIPGLSYTLELRRKPAPNRKWLMEVLLQGEPLARFTTLAREKRMAIQLQAAGGLILSRMIFEGKEEKK